MDADMTDIGFLRYFAHLMEEAAAFGLSIALFRPKEKNDGTSVCLYDAQGRCVQYADTLVDISHALVGYRAALGDFEYEIYDDEEEDDDPLAVIPGDYRFFFWGKQQMEGQPPETEPEPDPEPEAELPQGFINGGSNAVVHLKDLHEGPCGHSGGTIVAMPNMDKGSETQIAVTADALGCEEDLIRAKKFTVARIVAVQKYMNITMQPSGLHAFLSPKNRVEYSENDATWFATNPPGWHSQGVRYILRAESLGSDALDKAFTFLEQHPDMFSHSKAPSPELQEEFLRSFMYTQAEPEPDPEPEEELPPESRKGGSSYVTSSMAIENEVQNKPFFSVPLSEVDPFYLAQNVPVRRYTSNGPEHIPVDILREENKEMNENLFLDAVSWIQNNHNHDILLFFGELKGYDDSQAEVDGLPSETRAAISQILRRGKVTFTREFADQFQHNSFSLGRSFLPDEDTRDKVERDILAVIPHIIDWDSKKGYILGGAVDTARSIIAQYESSITPEDVRKVFFSELRGCQHSKWMDQRAKQKESEGEQ